MGVFCSYYFFAFDPFEMPSELTGRFLPCNLFLVLAKNVLFLCTSIDRGVHNERQGPKSYTICTAVPSTFPTILPSLSKEMEPRLGSIGIYYYLYICTTTYKMQSKKILLIHVQSILELIITFHTCFFLSLFSFSFFWVTTAHRGCKCRWKSTIYKIIRIIIIATHFPTSSFLYIHTLHSDV